MRVVEETGGVWRVLEGFGRHWKALGALYRGLVDSGGICSALDGSGRLWRTLTGFRRL